MSDATAKTDPYVEPPKLRRLAPISEACAYGKMGQATLYRHLSTGLLKAYKRGNRTLVDLNTIDAMNEALPPYLPLRLRGK